MGEQPDGTYSSKDNNMADMRILLHDSENLRNTIPFSLMETKSTHRPPGLCLNTLCTNLGQDSY